MNSAAEKDPVYSKLISLLENGGSCPEGLQAFCHYKKELFVLDGVVIFRGRSVVPKAL